MKEIMYLTPYSPNLNLIEGFRKWLKESNVFYNKAHEICSNIHAFLDDISKQADVVIDRLCVAL